MLAGTVKVGVGSWVMFYGYESPQKDRNTTMCFISTVFLVCDALKEQFYPGGTDVSGDKS